MEQNFKKYIFGYGSLINLESLSRTMHRTVNRNEIIPVKLINYKRVWNLKDIIFSEKLNKKVNGVFLNIENDENSFINGVVFEVNNSEFEYLSQRERNYSCVNVTENVLFENQFQYENIQIFTFIAIDEKYLQINTDNRTFVMSNYIKIVEDGCSNISSKFLQDFMNTTENNPFKILEGGYRFMSTD